MHDIRETFRPLTFCEMTADSETGHRNHPQTAGNCYNTPARSSAGGWFLGLFLVGNVTKCHTTYTA